MKPNSLLAATSAPEAVCLTWKVPRGTVDARFVRDTDVMAWEPTVRLEVSAPPTE